MRAPEPPVLYRHTTENISGYLGLLRPEGARCLTVSASGDHAVNLLAAGAGTVVSFDREPLAGRIQDLKLASVAALGYDEFAEFWGEEEAGSFRPDLLERALPGVGYCDAWFRERLADPGRAFSGYITRREWNPYLSSPEAYARAQAAVRAAAERASDPRFRPRRGPRASLAVAAMTCDVRDLVEVGVPGVFDVVVLSNVLDHWLNGVREAFRVLEYATHDHKHDWEVMGDRPLLNAAREIVWPLARALAPGGRMLAGYFYHNRDREFGNLRAAFAPEPGFRVRLVRIPACNGEDVPDVAVLVERKRAARQKSPSKKSSSTRAA